MNRAGVSPKELSPERLKYVLVSLMILIFLYPVIERGGFSSRLLNVFFTMLLLTTIYVTSSSGRRLTIALCIGIPWMIAAWAHTFFQGSGSLMVAAAFLTLFCGYTGLAIMSYVLSAKKITRDMICGALSVYLLIGLIWVGAFTLVEAIQPGSFASSSGEALNASDFLYYSFVTLTTLGYGDIVPITARARSLAILEAITGVLFSAVLIARLVGTRIAHMTDSRE
jgi:uncharacterized membrane protein